VVFGVFLVWVYVTSSEAAFGKNGGNTHLKGHHRHKREKLSAGVQISERRLKHK